MAVVKLGMQLWVSTGTESSFISGDICRPRDVTVYYCQWQNSEAGAKRYKTTTANEDGSHWRVSLLAFPVDLLTRRWWNAVGGKSPAWSASILVGSPR